MNKIRNSPTMKELGLIKPRLLSSKVFSFILNRLLGLMDKLNKLIASIALGIFNFGKVETKPVRLKEILVKTKDGAKLATDVYLPKEAYEKRKKVPTILVRLPYWKKIFSILGYAVASKGYAIVLQDVRGTASSIDHGTFSFYLTERSDGLDTLDWIKNRFWYDGKIGTWGPSYLGTTQLTLANHHKGLLTCMVPSQVSFSSMLFHRGGLSQLGIIAAVLEIFLAITQSKEPCLDYTPIDTERVSERLFRNPKASLYNEPLNSKRYLVDILKLQGLGLKETVEKINKTFNLQMNPSKKDNGNIKKLLALILYHKKIKIDNTHLPGFDDIDFSKITVPILNVGGWYDLFCENTMEDFKNFMKVASEEQKKKFKVIMGPWSHIDVGHPDDKNDIGGLIGIIENIIPLWWYEYWLKDVETDLISSPPLKIFVMGKRIWRYLNEWPPKASKLVKFYLHSEGNANTRFGDGKLSKSMPNNESNDEFVFDPFNPVLTNAGNNLDMVRGGHDQLKIEERDDVLVFTSETLQEGIEVTGEIQVELYASSSVKDTDFMAKLVDVYPDENKAINIVDSGIRTRFRDGNRDNPSLIELDKIYKYNIFVGPTSIYFKKGHKIRLEISSSNFPKFDVNSNLAGEENGDGYISATQKIFHDSKHPSCLILPIYPNNK